MRTPQPLGAAGSSHGREPRGSPRHMSPSPGRGRQKPCWLTPRGLCRPLRGPGNQPCPDPRAHARGYFLSPFGLAGCLNLTLLVPGVLFQTFETKTAAPPLLQTNKATTGCCSANPVPHPVARGQSGQSGRLAGGVSRGGGAAVPAPRRRGHRASDAGRGGPLPLPRRGRWHGDVAESSRLIRGWTRGHCDA